MYQLFHLLVTLFSLCLLASGNSYCGTVSNVTMIDPSAPHTDAMTYLKDASAHPWPVISSGLGDLRPIRYCYANKEAKDVLGCAVIAGLTVWGDAIGYPNIEQTHSLCWKSFMVKTTDGKGISPYYAPFCYLDDYENKDQPGTWNPLVHDDVLTIHLVQGSPAATVGYKPGNTPGRHKLMLPRGVDTKRVAHEIGHVIGLLHEHARFDRDQFITYKCTRLEGYSKALNAATDAGIHLVEASLRLCDDKQFAERFDFVGAQYTKNDGSTETGPIYDDGYFDYGSIMMYPTTAHAADKRCWTESRLDLCPLLAGTGSNTWPLPAPQVPSNGDIAFIKKYYPFVPALAPAPVPAPVPAPSSADNAVAAAIAASDQPTTSAVVEQVVEREVKRGPQAVVRVHHIFS